jgi:hypothetical protein
MLLVGEASFDPESGNAVSLYAVPAHRRAARVPGSEVVPLTSC